MSWTSNFWFILYVSNLHSSTMIFSVSIQSFLDFVPDSVDLTVKFPSKDMTKNFPENPLLAWNLLSHRKEIMESHLAQIPITPKQQRTFEVKEKVLASAGAQDMDTSGYELYRFSGKILSWSWLLSIDRGCLLPFHQNLSRTWTWEDYRKIILCWTKRKTRKILLQQLQCRSVLLNIPGCSEVVLLENHMKTCRNLFIRLSLINLTCVR